VSIHVHDETLARFPEFLKWSKNNRNTGAKIRFLEWNLIPAF
jgi:hypothetical protein